MRARSWSYVLVAMVGLFAAVIGWNWAAPSAVADGMRFAGPTSSQPLALSADDSLLAVANPDNNSVTFFNVAGGQSTRVQEVEVGQEPNGVALLPDGSKAYVSNTVSGTVSVIGINANGPDFKVIGTIRVGTEPYGLALTPNGTKLYVTNARSNSVSVIDTLSDKVIKTIRRVGFEPRGLAITNNGDESDTDETVYVTQFLSLPVPGKVDGQDDAKVGKVTVISTGSDDVVGDVTLNPLADTGFFANGDALARIPPGPTFDVQTGAYPNQLNNIGIRGGFAFVPNTGASPNGPFRFDVNTESLLSVIDLSSNTDANQTINMHKAVADASPPRLFHTIPWALAFKHGADEGYVISAASNIVFKLAVDPQTGAAQVQLNPSDPSHVLQIPVGKNPRGIVVNSTDTLAYVMNYVSRDVSVIDLTNQPEQVIATLPAAALPSRGTVADLIHVGKELYNTSVGVFDPAPGTDTPIVGRMSNNGWGGCATCHPNGLSDNVVWIFPSGPKRTIPQHTDFDRTDPERARQRILNWSAERDEEEDFELNIRAVSGGQGLIVLDDGITQDPNVFNLTPLASAGRNQLKVHGVNGWDAIKAFVQFGVRPPISPLRADEEDVRTGRRLFQKANCQACHGGPQWTNSAVTFTPPPGPDLIKDGQILDQLRQVGTFDPNAFNEVRANATPSIGADGFVPPSLLSIFAFPQTFFHNGSAASLEKVLKNVTHRTAGTGGVDVLSREEDRDRLVTFLLSIDARTQPIDPTEPF
ncbi:MAG TPA: beta-propeller fold lactonase family protein [Vicinamibacterales bacterium]|jgi:YVTN family beta-propeller protein|nr:beta-propeller fold lactonase family protein [Vicinamibacterales bacterium]